MDPTLRPSAGSASPGDVPVGEPVPSGPRFGKFVRERKLGAGGMGEVWKAWDTELRRWVALKFLLGGEPGEIGRFQREAQTAGGLNHPHIAAIYDVGVAQERHFIAMQFLDGTTLRDFPRTDRRALVRLVRDAALAVQYAHELGIVHRDLKPDNLMVVLRGGGGPGSSVQAPHVYVMDFGLARPVESHLSVSGSVVGTPAYMPPEQARGRRVDARADVYALGATMYELFTGRRLFDGESVYEILRKVQEEEPAPPRRLVPSLEADLETVILKCVEKDPERRYGTAQALADDLDRWLEGAPVLGRPPSALYRLSKFAARRRGILLTSAAAAALLAGLAAAFLPRWSADRAARRLAEEERGKEAEQNRVREERLKRLAVLWNAVVDRKRELRQLRTSAAEGRRGLEEALAALDGMIAESPGTPQAPYLKARGLVVLGRLAEAESLLRDTLARSPDFRPGWTLLGALRLEVYLRHLDGDRRYGKLLIQRGRPIIEDAAACFARGWDASAARAEQDRWGLAWTREDEVAGTIAEALRLSHVENRKEEARALLESSWASYKSEDVARQLSLWTAKPEERVRWLTEAVTLAPGYAEAWYDRANLRLDSDPDAALADFKHAIEIQPDWAQPIVNSAGIWWARNNAREALAALDRALEISPAFATALTSRGTVRSETGDAAGAAQDFDRALAADPEAPGAWEARGVSLAKQGRTKEALADFDRAVSLWGEEPTLRYNRGLARYTTGDMKGSLEDLDVAIRLSPQYVDAIYQRHFARVGLGDAAGSIADLDRVLELKETHAGARLARGNRRFVARDLPGALADFDRLVELEPRNAQAWQKRGVVRGLMNALPEALADLDQAIALDAGDFRTWANRAEFRSRAGHRNGAAEDLRKALALLPADSPHRAGLEGKLRELER